MNPYHNNLSSFSVFNDSEKINAISQNGKNNSEYPFSQTAWPIKHQEQNNWYTFNRTPTNDSLTKSFSQKNNYSIIKPDSTHLNAKKSFRANRGYPASKTTEASDPLTPPTILNWENYLTSNSKYVLSLQWPAGACYAYANYDHHWLVHGHVSKNTKPKKCIPKKIEPNKFYIHGFWPRTPMNTSSTPFTPVKTISEDSFSQDFLKVAYSHWVNLLGHNFNFLINQLFKHALNWTVPAILENKVKLFEHRKEESVCKFTDTNHIRKFKCFVKTAFDLTTKLNFFTTLSKVKSTRKPIPVVVEDNQAFSDASLITTPSPTIVPESMSIIPSSSQPYRVDYFLAKIEASYNIENCAFLYCKGVTNADGENKYILIEVRFCYDDDLKLTSCGNSLEISKQFCQADVLYYLEETRV
jgi:ribonuclease I